MALIDTVPTSKVRLPSIISGHQNGKLPAAMLRNFDGRGGLLEIVSYGMQAIHLAALTDNIDVETVGRYRSYDQQETLFRSRYAPQPPTTRGSKVWNGVRWFNQRGAMAAVPGNSNHGWGCADDVAEESDGTPGAESMSDRQLTWMRDNAPDFGFGLETRKERWHWHWTSGDVLPRRAREVLTFCGVNFPAKFGGSVPAPEPPPITPPPGLITSAPPAVPTPLRKGVVDLHRVRWLQQILNERFGGVLVVDGGFGDKTHAAVIVMQQILGVGQDGVYGQQTAAALAAWLVTH